MTNRLACIKEEGAKERAAILAHKRDAADELATKLREEARMKHDRADALRKQVALSAGQVLTKSPPGLHQVSARSPPGGGVWNSGGGRHLKEKHKYDLNMAAAIAASLQEK